MRMEALGVNRLERKGRTMTRIAELKRDDVAKEGLEAFDAVHASGKPQGPGAIAIHSPELARRRIPMNGYLRWEMTVNQRIHELERTRR